MTSRRINRNVKKERKFTFNIVDVLILILISVLIAFIVYSFFLGNDVAKLISPKKDISYTLQFSNSDGYENLTVGENVISGENKKSLGKIESITFDTSSGTVTITVNATGYVKSGTHYVNGIEISDKKTVSVSFENAPENNMNCFDVAEKNTEE